MKDKKNRNKKIKCLLLFSGGLDSILAAKVLVEQGIEVKGISFESYFFDAKQAKEMARKIKLPLKVVNFSEEHLKLVKKPRYGYGKRINPCIDCHILMLEIARKMMKKNGFDFIATGEVLGERPMSQNKRSLKLIEKQSGLEGHLLRPLSAKLLKPIILEQTGQIDREKLLNILGRGRQKQMALAKKYGIKEYPVPAGGCLLTDVEFSKRLKELWGICPKCGGDDIELLKLGRHIWDKEIKIVVGRDENENKEIKKKMMKKDILIEMKKISGPLTLVRNYAKGKISELALEKAKKLTQYYSVKAREKNNVEFNVKSC